MAQIRSIDRSIDRSINRSIAAFTRMPLLAAVAVLTLGISASAWAQANCNPQCAAGQVCVQGVCMVPAPAQPAASPPPPAYYPPPASSPPPGYYAPPPAAPPPGYYPPPASSPPPAYYGQQPPPAYAPPPGYAQPGAYPPPGEGYPPPPPRAPSTHRGFLAIPYLGINSFQGKTGTGLGPGFRLGTLIGGHVGEGFSINGELTFDFLNVENVPADTDVSSLDFTLTVSPLFHLLAASNLEFVLGPRLGIRAGSTRYSNFGDDTTYSSTGYIFGANAGLFADVSNSMAIGGLLSFDIRTVHQYCVTQPGFTEQCATDSASTGAADKVLGMAAALLF